MANGTAKDRKDRYGDENDNTKQFDRFEKAVQRQAAALEAEGNTVGENVGVQAQLRTQLVLTEAAQQAGIKVTGDYKDKIDALAERVGNATLKLAELKLQSNIQFDRDQVGRSPIDAQVASQLRAVYGDNYTSMMDSATAAQMRLNLQLAQSRDLFVDTLTGGVSTFRSELEQTGKVFESVEKAGVNMANKISDALLNMALKEQVAKLYAGAGGFNIFGALGLGGSTTAAGGQNAGAGASASLENPSLYGDGGFTGHGDVGEVAGLVHRKEFVVKASQTAKHYPLLKAINDNHFPGYADGGYVGGDAPYASVRAGGSRAPSVQVNSTIEFHTHGAPAPSRVQQSTTSKGSRRVDAYFDETMAQSAGKPGSAVDKTLRQRGRLVTG